MKKTEVEKLYISDYNYNLPEDRIAKYPLPERDESKLLVYRGGEIGIRPFTQLPFCIPKNSLMIFNDTKVIHARLHFRKTTGAAIEIFCLSPSSPQDYVINFQQRESCSWHCMIGNAKKWKNEVLSLEIPFENHLIILNAEKQSVNGNDTVVTFSWSGREVTFSELLEIAGDLPIPPYLNRDAEAADNETYQTVYSRIEGSVAAPTAGLHFTARVMKELEKQDIHMAKVTLHVGAGTFKPIKSETIGKHEMHTEFISVSKSTVEAILYNQSPLVVVGTTSARTVESLYYLGKKILLNPDISTQDLFVGQWEPYEETNPVSPEASLQAILCYLENNHLDALMAFTSIMIAPGYVFHFTDAIVTNFHQPQSTLLLLVSALVGNDWRTVYDYALKNNFRFLSYGDSSLLWRIAK